MALSAVLLGFSSATQDVVIDAYRIEIAQGDSAMQSVIAATYNAGYRIGDCGGRGRAVFGRLAGLARADTCIALGSKLI